MSCSFPIAGLFSIAALSLAFASPAAAQESGGKIQVTVLPLPTTQIPPSLVDVILDSTAKQIRGQYKVKVLSGRSVGRAVWGTLGSGLEEAAMHFTSNVAAGQKAYRLLQIDEAIERLESAQEWQELCAPEIRNTELFTNLQLYAGLSFLAQGEQIKAQAAFRQAVSHNPDLQLSKRKFPPDVLEAFERARREVFSQKPTQVAVVSRPSGAAIYIDGKYRGTTPSESTAMYPGKHYVRLELEGYAPWTLSFSESSPPKQIKALLVPLWTGEPPEDLLASAITAETLDEPQLAQLRLLAGFFRADALVLMHISSKDHATFVGMRVFVVSPESVSRARLFSLGASTKEFPRKLEGVVGAMDALASASGTGSMATPALPMASLADPPREDPDVLDPIAMATDPVAAPGNRGWTQPPLDEPVVATPWYQSWWFWTLAGLAVAGGATGGALWLMQPEGSWTLVIK